MSSVRMYISSAPGILNFWQVVLSFSVVFTLMASRYGPDGRYELNMSVLLLLLTSFAFFVSSLLMLVGVLLGTLDLQYSPLYRLKYFLATIVYLPCTAAFAFGELGSSLATDAFVAMGLALANSVMFFSSTLIAYRPLLCPAVTIF